MPTRLRNVTLSLPDELLKKFKRYAKENYITSLNEGVKEALEEYSRSIEKKMLREEMLKAAGDPLFINDLEDSMKAFETSDYDAAREAQEW